MEPTETKLSLNSEKDLLAVHSLAIKLASDSGLTAEESIRFACQIVEAYLTEGRKVDQIKLSSIIKDEQVIVTASLFPGGKTIEAPVLSDDSKRSSRLKNVNVETIQAPNLKDMQQFTYALSHDLKNSLTKLKLALSLVEEQDMSPLIFNYVQIIHRSAASLEKTMMSLNQIMEMGHESVAVLKQVILKEVYEDVLVEFIDELQKSNGKIVADFCEPNVIRYIEVYVRSVFSNLISNAIKYAIPSRPLQIDISCKRVGDAFELSFTDNGEGIDLERYGTQLFSAFKRFSRSAEGSGNGLYLIRTMIERNGGTIRAESEPGKGTCFIITLKEYSLPVAA